MGGVWWVERASTKTYSHCLAGRAVVHWLAPEAVRAPPSAHQTLYVEASVGNLGVNKQKKKEEKTFSFNDRCK